MAYRVVLLFPSELTPSCSVIAGLEPLQSESPAPLDELNKKQVYVVPRPPYKHIQPPAGFSREDHCEPVISVPKDMVKAIEREKAQISCNKREDGSCIGI